MTWIQRSVTLTSRQRGFHLVTSEIVSAVPGIAELRVGMLQAFIQHTSASLALNENADPDVRTDLESWFSRAVKENEPYYEHTCEGADDMPAHIKGVLIGSSVTVPISGGRLATGTWQGIYLCEHRDRGGPRSVVVTAWGE